MCVAATDHHFKRKIRRRSSWGRGIIRKKKANKKGAEGEVEAEGEEEEEPEAEMEVTGPSDSCLTLDEEDSSCDTVGPQTNGHAPSTEEESSNETPAVTVASTEEVPAASEEEPEVAEEDGDAAEDDEKRSPSHAAAGDGPHAAEPEDRDNRSETSLPSLPSPPPGHAEEGPVEASRAACVNGNESMDSVDSGSVRMGHGEDAQQRPPEADEHKEKHSGEPSQERHLQDGRAAVAEKIQDEDEGGA